ncbi:hypothetical protein FQN57_000835 [Myotisia sp. PD_48]|nr:hypothetical protein FQN57_000835 [Myotisia sp. PD_48]
MPTSLAEKSTNVGGCAWNTIDPSLARACPGPAWEVVFLIDFLKFPTKFCRKFFCLGQGLGVVNMPAASRTSHLPTAMMRKATDSGSGASDKLSVLEQQFRPFATRRSRDNITTVVLK